MTTASGKQHDEADSRLTVKTLGYDTAGTRATKTHPSENRGAVQRVLEARAYHGADDEIIGHAERARVFYGRILEWQRDAAQDM